MHRDAVRALVLTRAEELLLVQIRLPDVPEPFWIAPGGGLKPGESVDDGLRRELREELGLGTTNAVRFCGAGITPSL